MLNKGFLSPCGDAVGFYEAIAEVADIVIFDALSIQWVKPYPGPRVTVIITDSESDGIIGIIALCPVFLQSGDVLTGSNRVRTCSCRCITAAFPFERLHNDGDDITRMKYCIQITDDI